MKKILFVFHDSNPKSGATASMLEVVNFINSLNVYHITALIPNHKSGLHRCLEDADIEYFEEEIFNVRFIKNSKLSVLYRFKSVVKVILNFVLALKLYRRKISYDIIYTNTSDVYIGAFLSKFLDVPHIWHIREFGIEDQNRDHFLGEKNFYNLVDKSSKVIAISNSLHSKLTKFGVKPNRMEVIYNDVSRGLVQYEREYNLYNPLSLLIVGSLSAEKGHDFLINCVKYMKDRGLEVKLGIVGDDTTDFARALFTRIKENACEEQITFHGYSTDVDKIRAKYDISVVASKSEAFGRVTIEAMHAKMTVLASDCGANPELITHGENGFLYKDSCLESFYSLLLSIDRNRGILKDVGEKAYQYSASFSSNRAAKKINDVILGLLD